MKYYFFSALAIIFAPSIASAQTEQESIEWINRQSSCQFTQTNNNYGSMTDHTVRMSIVNEYWLEISELSEENRNGRRNSSFTRYSAAHRIRISQIERIRVNSDQSMSFYCRNETNCVYSRSINGWEINWTPDESSTAMNFYSGRSRASHMSATVTRGCDVSTGRIANALQHLASLRGQQIAVTSYNPDTF